MPHDELNLSFVLHERSSSSAVRTAARDSARSRARRLRLARPQHPATISGDPSQPHDFVLTTRLGAYDALGSSLGNVTAREARPILCIDEVSEGLVPQEFFRAPALLSIPSAADAKALVAALVVRPDGKSTHLRIEGCFDWPRERERAIAAIEALVQAYADQWDPGRALWSDPAESMLPDEIQ